MESNNFETSDDVEFVLRGGNDQQTALYNRIAAINRINYLVRKEIPEFDIRVKSEVFMQCLDLELWVRFYKDEPGDKKIDETFCKRAAEVCIEMEKEQPEFKKDEFDKAVDSAKVAPKENKDNWISRFFKKK